MEKAAKIGMPLLIAFGVFLAYRGLTLGTSGASAEVPDASAWDGLNFLWTPQFDSLTNPKVWLAAAGQIFFTLSVGMGTIHCYAAYVRSKDDIALNAVSAGFMNEFVEVVLGSLIVIPIAAGYLGLDWVRKMQASAWRSRQCLSSLINGADPWSDSWRYVVRALVLAALPAAWRWYAVDAFMRDEFGWGRMKALGLSERSAHAGLAHGDLLPTWVFDEYDYWAGTCSLVVFAMRRGYSFHGSSVW